MLGTEKIRIDGYNNADLQELYVELEKQKSKLGSDDLDFIKNTTRELTDYKLVSRSDVDRCLALLRACEVKAPSDIFKSRKAETAFGTTLGKLAAAVGKIGRDKTDLTIKTTLKSDEGSTFEQEALFDKILSKCKRVVNRGAEKFEDLYDKMCEGKATLIMAVRGRGDVYEQRGDHIKYTYPDGTVVEGSMKEQAAKVAETYAILDSIRTYRDPMAGQVRFILR